MNAKEEKILAVIRNCQPIHLSRISRIANIPLSTVYYYLRGNLKDKVVCKVFEGTKKPNTTMYSLKEPIQ